MHIEFKRIILHNFMSFGDADLKFNDDGFIRVSGINENPLDNAGSNGSGKSSLWEAIIWAITGETIRGTKQIVNIYGEDGCFVDIEFYVDNKRYQLIRSKDHKVRKTNLQILIDGQDVSGKGIRDSEKLIQQYLPDITASLLGSVIILGQGLPQKFTNNTPSGRKEVLEKLSKSDFMIEDLKKRVSDRKAELQTELRGYEDNISNNQGKISFLRKQLTESEDLLRTLNKEEIETVLNSYKDELSKISKLIEDNDGEYDDYYSSYNNICTELNTINSNKTSEIENRTTQYNETIAPYKQSSDTLYVEYKSINRQIAQMKAIKDVCPTCGQKMPDIHKPDTTKLEQESNELYLKLQEVNDCLISYEQTFKQDIEEIRTRYDSQGASLNSESQKINTKLSMLRTDRQNMSAKQSQLANVISTEEVKLAQLQATIDNCNKIIRDNNEFITITEDEIMYNNKQKDLTQSHLEVISKFDTALKRDFRGYLLSTVISFIEERAKYYSSIIFDTKSISFCLDGNNIDISYMNRAYENLSGGEKQKIDLIIQFSIRDMLSTQLGFTSNILVLDEVFDGLDSLGCTKVIDMIASVSDIKNIFIVTHRKDLSIPSDKELIVVKSSVGISEIRQ